MHAPASTFLHPYMRLFSSLSILKIFERGEGNPYQVPLPHLKVAPPPLLQGRPAGCLRQVLRTDPHASRGTQPAPCEGLSLRSLQVGGRCERLRGDLASSARRSFSLENDIYRWYTGFIDWIATVLGWPSSRSDPLRFKNKIFIFEGGFQYISY